MGAESKIEKYLRAEIKLLGGWMRKHAEPGTRGAPDDDVFWPADPECHGPLPFIGRYQPTVEFIETKAPDGRLTVLQKKYHERLRNLGFEVHVIWNMELADQYLRSRGKR